MMVILKPPLWVMDTESAGGTKWLSQYLQSLCFWPHRSVALDASHSYGFLHRLDTLSSGLVMTAKTYEAYYHLKFQLICGTFVRDYVVLCHGCIPSNRCEIRGQVYFWNVEGNLASMICQRGKPSTTCLKVLVHLAHLQQRFGLVAIRIS